MVGEFDGVHIGHCEVIRDVDSVLIFELYLCIVVVLVLVFKLLMTFEQKVDLIVVFGV